MPNSTVAKWRLAHPVVFALIAAGWVCSPAWALTLGRISAESTVGQPLLAQIEVAQISAEQAATLEIALASPEGFAAANMSLNPILNGLRTSLIASDTPGQATIRLETSAPVAEPFLDVALEFRWAGGLLVQTYTLLLNPPNLLPADQAPSSAPMPTPLAPVVPLSPPSPEADPLTAPVDSAPVEAAPVEAAPVETAPEVVAAPVTRVDVRRGDTLGRIAERFLEPGVTLDQLLLALLRANPDAFINGNVNLVKAGATLQIPDMAAALSVSAPQARQEVRAQTREFIAYRQRLAQAAPARAVDQPAQRIEGRVEEPVVVVTPESLAQDRLELTRGSDAQNQTSQDIAQSRQEQEDQARLTELERNLEELQALASAAGDNETPAFDPSLPLVDEQEELLTLPIAMSEPAAAEADKTPADNAREAVERLIQHPLTGPLALALIALLAALGVMRARRMRQSQSFQKTAERAAAHTTAAATTPTAMPAVEPTASDDPVDPLSEAEVYLAYGMDEQAESMLRQALAEDPDSLIARLRLLDIYKMRQDVVAFNATAQDVYDITLGQTPEWESVAGIGRELDPSNPLYHPIPTGEASNGLDLPDDVKDLSLDLDPPSDGSPRQP